MKRGDLTIGTVVYAARSYGAPRGPGTVAGFDGVYHVYEGGRWNRQRVEKANGIRVQWDDGAEDVYDTARGLIPESEGVALIAKTKQREQSESASQEVAAALGSLLTAALALPEPGPYDSGPGTSTVDTVLITLPTDAAQRLLDILTGETP